VQDALSFRVVPQVHGALRVYVAYARWAVASATLDTPPLDLGVEDHQTAAPLSVRKTDAALGLLEDLLAIELMLPFAWCRRRSLWRIRSQTQSTGPFESASPSGGWVRP
jgi:histidine ammonia-lyase